MTHGTPHYFVRLATAAFGVWLWAAPAAANDRTVAVTGMGEILAEPDRATVLLGVEARKPQLAAARTEVARGVDAILKLTRDLKIDPKYVRTTRLNVQPEYDWNNPERQRKLLGYYVLRQVEIDLRDLDQLGTLLERAVSLGANQVGEAQLDSTRRREFERAALAKAIEDAKLNADAAAKASGTKLGAVRSINTSGAVAPPMPMPYERTLMKSAIASDAGRAETYQIGQMSFSATAQVVYDLIVP
jgi:uncharacterized protein YggE